MQVFVEILGNEKVKIEEIWCKKIFLKINQKKRDFVF
jgi:hypothetical protein